MAAASDPSQQQQQQLTNNATDLSNGSQLDDGADDGYADATAQAASCVAFLRLYAAPALTVVCVAGSCLVLSSAARRWRSLKPKYYVLVVLTVADCVTMLSSAFFNQFLHYGLGVSMPHVASITACKLWSLVWIISNGLSTNLLCFLAIDRLYAVGKPFRHRASMTKSRYCLLLAMFSAPFAAAGAFGVGTFTTYKYMGQRHCYISVNLPGWLGISYQAYATLVANGTLGSCFLLAANAILAWRICTAMRTSARYRPGGSAASPRGSHGFSGVSGQSGAAMRTGVTLMAASAAHLIGSLPRAVTYLIAGVIQYGGLASESPAVAEQLQLVFQLGGCFDYLFFANCSLNWLIYCAQVPQLRPW